MSKVLVIGGENANYRRILEENGVEVSFFFSKDEEEIAKAAEGAVGIIFTSTRFTSSLFDKLPSVKIISRAGIGIDTVDMAAATAHGVMVCNSARYGTYDVAQHTMALMLSLLHSVPRYDSRVRRDADWSGQDVPMAARLSERTVGIVGFGRISRNLARMLSGFGTRVMAYDPYLPSEVMEEAGVVPATLDELFAAADIISVNAPLTDSTYHLLSHEAFAKMKDGVLLVNTSRGPLIDEAALVETLTSGKVGGAALDVFENEPFAPDHPFTTLPNVVLTPHIAWRSTEAVRDLGEEVTGNILTYLKGERPANCLNMK